MVTVLSTVGISKTGELRFKEVGGLKATLLHRVVCIWNRLPEEVVEAGYCYTV